MLDLNARCLESLPFQLPTLDGLADLLLATALRGDKVFYCTLDIHNYFWSCKLPEGARDIIRIGVGGRFLRCKSYLPFGWKHSPSMAKAILAVYLVEHYAGSVVVIQYADDVLVAGRCHEQVGSQAAATKVDLERVGWVASPKSRLEPEFTT